MNDLIKINENGKPTARELYEFLQLNPSNFSKWCKSNITENQFALENTDWLRLVLEDETPTGGQIERIDYELSIDFAKKLCMVSKSKRGEQARNYFIEVEKRLKEIQTKPMSQLEIIAANAIALVEQEKRVAELTARQDQQDKVLQGIRDVVALNPNDWRKDTAILINRIAQLMGGCEHVQAIRAESYKLLNLRMGVDLKRRLTNKRQRLAAEGVCKSKQDKVNSLDVIADDKKLIEGYIAIVKEMAIKYGVDKSA